MPPVVDTLGNKLHSGWLWWTNELLDMVPASVRSIAVMPDDELILNVDDGHVALGQRPAKGSAPALEMASDDADAWRQIASLARRGQRPEVAVVVQHGACFERRIEIPKSARKNADRILALDLERATPFKAKDVLTAHLVEPLPGRSGFLQARQFILKRDIIAPLIAAVDQAGGRVRRISFRPAGWREGKIDFVEPSLGASKRRTSRLAAKLLATVAVLGSLAITLHWWRNDQALASLNASTSAARASLETRRIQSTTTSTATQDAAAVRARKAQVIPAVVLVNELTRLLPDDTYLSELRIADGAIELSGFARRASSLIATLEQGEFFSDAALTAPVIFDSNADRERFNLRLTLRHLPIGTAAENAIEEEPQ